ncbi:MAG TPA: histidine phosphatase family protein [Candidatus Binataceae bacterium]|nr:histidine phosphatase family protein [Candidatus Binataceae bacterium]
MTTATQRSRLILVRHGETEGESSIRYHGRTDVALSDLGRQQLRAARDEIIRRHGPARFDHVFASPLIRAIEGARIVGGDPATIVTINDFAEVHFGRFEGLTAEEICERYPQDYAQWNADRLAPTYTYPGGESRTAFAERVDRGVDQMLAHWRVETNSTASHALVVAHRGVIRQIVRRLTGAQPNVELGSIQVLEFEGQWHPLALDVIEHLI